MRTRVYIATTQGPSQVWWLAREQPRMPGDGPEIYSDVYLSDPPERLVKLAGAYKDFVRKPTGVIERLFGHPVFILELARRIDDGESWKLGAFAAHALLNEGQLALRDEVPERVVWLTGRIGRDGALPVRSVAEVQQKLEHSAELVKECREAGIPISCFIPSENYHEISPEWFTELRDKLEVDEESLPIIPLTSAFELADELGLKEFARLAEELRDEPGDRGGANTPGPESEEARDPPIELMEHDSSLPAPLHGGELVAGDRLPMRLAPRRPVAVALRGAASIAIALMLAALALMLVPRNRLQGWADFIGVAEYAAFNRSSDFADDGRESDARAVDRGETPIGEGRGALPVDEFEPGIEGAAAGDRANDEISNAVDGRGLEGSRASAAATPINSSASAGTSGTDAAPVALRFTMEAEARVLPDGSNCALVSNREVEVRPIEATGRATFAATPHAGLCSVAYRARNTSDSPLYLWLQVTPLTSDHRYRIQRKQGRPVTARVEPGDALSLYIVPRAFARDDVSYRIFALASEEPSDEVLDMLPTNETAAESDPARLIERTQALGLSSQIRTHEILAR